MTSYKDRMETPLLILICLAIGTMALKRRGSTASISFVCFSEECLYREIYRNPTFYPLAQISLIMKMSEKRDFEV